MSLIKHLYNLLFPPAPTKEQNLRAYHDIIEEINLFYADDKDLPNNRHVEESYMPDAKFFRYKGTVTHVYSDGNGRIDDKYIFSSEAAVHLGKQLDSGYKVSCTARKLSEDQPVVIYKIDSIEEDVWSEGNFEFDDSKTTKPIPLKTYQKWLKGSVKQKLNGEITIDSIPKWIRIMISESGCAFNPMVGDQVEVEAVYGINQNDLNDSSLIGYYELKANDKKFITGVITTFKKKLHYGLVDDKYIFYLGVLQHSNNQNCVPNKGDKVSCTVISSLQMIDDREFFWRCTDLVKIRSANENKSGSASQMPENDNESDDESDDMDCGLEITKNEHLKVTLDAAQPQKTIELKMVNVSKQSHKISKVKFENEILASQIDCNDLYTMRTIQLSGQLLYRIDVCGKIRGEHKLKFEFKIDNTHVVRRCITIEVKAVDEIIVTPPVVHSKAYTRSLYNGKADIVKGVRPVDSPHFIDQRLDRFEVPKKLFEDLTSNEKYDLDAKYGELFSSLSVRNYGNFFHSLLYFEEIYMRHEFRMYDQDRGHFIREGEYLCYDMNKNVFECRPSIIIGDMIYAQSLLQPASASGEPIQYQGFIHKIKGKRIYLKFSDEFHCMYLGEDYKLIFKFSRSKFIKQHNGVERIALKMRKNGFEFLFPTGIKSGKRLQIDIDLVDGDMVLKFPKQNIPWFNKKLNEIQRHAVFNVLRGEVKMCPYIVFGPPGTGKTSTLIEIILQLYRKGNSRLIVAAPSNSAANLITKLLAESGALKPGEFARIAEQNSILRDQIPDELRQHCITVDIAAPRSRVEPQNPFENGIRVQCNSAHISLHRILISTCMTFGSLLYMKFKPGHFTHAIIDEAGQCTEPEIAIPISLIDNTEGQIILAGDPQQLGPVVLSPVSKRCGLGRSLLARLLDYLPYKSDIGRSGGFDERMITQLLHNYRSLPSILSTYSNLSYESKLIPNISAEDSDEQKLLEKLQEEMHKICKLNHVPKHGVYFLGVVGKDVQYAGSTSWCNYAEVLEVVTTIGLSLLRCGLTEDDIGIITPYTLQVQELRLVGGEYFDGAEPKIGTVEEFQGQERKVIIISTVRSRKRYVSHDGKCGLGFINNKNRLNVAISRARAMLIIVGNPYVLSEDDNWRQIIYDCYVNGSYSGVDVPEAVRRHME